MSDWNQLAVSTKCLLVEKENGTSVKVESAVRGKSAVKASEYQREASGTACQSRRTVITGI